MAEGEKIPTFSLTQGRNITPKSTTAGVTVVGSGALVTIWNWAVPSMVMPQEVGYAFIALATWLMTIWVND